MATYKAIKGLGIQTFSGDHPNAAAGDVWYNATLGKLRVHKLEQVLGHQVLIIPQLEK